LHALVALMTCLLSIVKSYLPGAGHFEGLFKALFDLRPAARAGCIRQKDRNSIGYSVRHSIRTK
jgi:hypothetical protein